MRKEFPGHYRPKKEEFAEKFKNCIFCFDTNFLLNLYRYTPETRDSVLKVLRHPNIRDRIWLPHRVAFEYHRRRVEVLLSEVNLVDHAVKAISNAIKEIEEPCRTPMFAADALMNPIKAELQAMKEKIAAKREQKPDLLEGDPILDTLTELFENKVGVPYPPEREKEIYKLGKERYAEKIPPGFKDISQKPNEVDQYGDLILWLQIIDFANTSDRPIVLVTDDSKEDWWREEKGHVLGPRPELVEEFGAKTQGKWFYLYSTERFLEFANEHLQAAVTNAAIKETQELKKQDAEVETARCTSAALSTRVVDDLIRRGRTGGISPATIAALTNKNAVVAAATSPKAMAFLEEIKRQAAERAAMIDPIVKEYERHKDLINNSIDWEFIEQMKRASEDAKRWYSDQDCYFGPQSQDSDSK